MEEVFDVIRHNISRILSIYNVNNTSGLKNYASSVDSEEAKRLFRNEYGNVFFINSTQSSSQGLRDDPNSLNTKYVERQLSYFEKKVFKKYRNLQSILDEERKRSREKD